MNTAIDRLNKAAIVVLMVLIIVTQARADGYDVFRVQDYRSLMPILASNITLTSAGGYELSTLTDSMGQADLLSSTTDSWNITVSRTGYAPYSSQHAWTNDTKQVYLTPFSSEGIIYIKYVDLTLGGDHESCLFYASNGRLHGCSHINDTITIHNNIGYVWRPVVGKADMISSLETLERNLSTYLPALEGIVVVLFIIVLMIVVVRFGFKGREQ